MQFSTLTLPLIALLATLTVAAPAANAAPTDVAAPVEVADTSNIALEPAFENDGGVVADNDDEDLAVFKRSLQKRGFGCPNDSKCHSHCEFLNMKKLI